MKIFNDIAEASKSINKSVVSIGNFDGVHLGHQQLIMLLKQKSVEYQALSTIITFDPHPRHFFEPESSFQILSTFKEKQNLFSLNGIDCLIKLSFNQELASTDFEVFLESFLLQMLNMKCLLIGYDHHFGNNRGGSLNSMENKLKDKRFEALPVSAYTIYDEIVSSKTIRNELINGNIEKTNLYLGYYYSITGVVISGNRIGRKLGYHTANIKPDNSEKQIPGMGVYAVVCYVNKILYRGMANIGIRPTLDLNKLSIEAHLFDFDDDIYDSAIQIFFLKKIRNEMRFPNLEQLTFQLQQDKERVRKYFAENDFDIKKIIINI